MADGSLKFDTKIDAGSFQKGLNNLSKTAETGLQGVGVMLGTLGAAAVAGVIAGARAYVDGAIDVASDLKEVQNVVDVTFKESSGAVNQWAKDAKNAYGMSELKAKQYTSTMGAMLKSMQLSMDQVLSMSMGVAGLTGDMASFYNLKHEDAFEKIKSGIAGETEGLKSLGINMSVANLEAYALSKGITKNFNSMNQGEQATLRYNYLMQVTADAQGDFARTSDGYANQQRILATTQEELAAAIGEMFLPVALEATKALNSLVGSLGDAVEWFANLFNPPKSELDTQIEAAKRAVDDFNGAVSTAGKNLDTTLASAKATQATAMSLLKNYEEIQSKNVLTENDTAQLRTIARQIVSLYPDMGTAINTATGLFNVNTGAVKDNIKALADQQTSMAYYAATQEYQTALIDASVVEQMAAASYKTAYDNWSVDDDALDSVKQLGSAISDNADAMTQYAGLLISLNPAFAEWFDVAADGTYVLNDLGRVAYEVGDVSREYGVALGVAAKAEQVSSAAASELEINLNKATETRVKATEEMALATKALTDYGDAFKPPIEGTEELMTVTEKATRKYPPFISMLKAEREETTRLQAALKTLSDKTLQQIDAQINGYEKIKKVRPKSAKQTTKDVNSQTKYLEDYTANFKKAQENGVSPEALTSLAEVTDENAAILAGLAKASDTEITNFNAAVEARNTERTELSTELAGFLTDLTTANTTLDIAIAGAGPIATQASENVFRKLREVGADSKTEADGVSQAATDAKAAKDSIKTSATEAQMAVQGMVDGIGTIVDDSAETLLTAGAEITEEVANGVVGNRAIETVMRDQVTRGIKRAREQANQANYVGVAIVNGIGAGAQSRGNWLNNILQQIIKDALAAARAAAQVNSPSKLFARMLGSPLAEGIGYGFMAEMKNVNDTIAQSVADSVPTINLSRQRSQWQALALNEAATDMQPGTIDARQYVTFQYSVQAPDEVSRAIRKSNTHGLAASRRKA